MGKTVDYKWFKIQYAESRVFEELIMAENKDEASLDFIERLNKDEFQAAELEVGYYSIERENNLSSEENKDEKKDETWGVKS